MEEQRDQRSVPLGLEEPTGLISIDDACQDPCYSSSNSFDYSFISPIFEPDLSLSWSSSFDLSPPWGTSSDLLHSVHETKLLSSAASDIYSLNNPYSFTDLDSNGDSSKYWGTWPEASTLPRPLYNHFDQGSSHLSYEYLAACEPLQSLFHTEPRTNVNDELSLRRCPYSSPAVSSLPTQSPSQCEPPPGWIKSERTHRPLAPVTSEDVTRAHSQPDKEHYCERCDIQFSQRKNLDRHNSAFHTGKAPKEKCHHDSCGKAFHRHDNLVAHLKRYHGDQRQPTRSATFPNPSPKSACSRSPRCNNKAINDNLSSSAPNIP
ncbi:hypothetical protein BJY04DRAFT_120717 [Aspergillus karnatakaensis]|uniref:uncharacterized protein n=1 Tax=Aspergillus karnatakaensis TaxID=1810916 RepID=UPI003CCD520C